MRKIFFLGLCYIIEGNNDLAIDEYKILKEKNNELADELFKLIFNK